MIELLLLTKTYICIQAVRGSGPDGQIRANDVMTAQPGVASTAAAVVHPSTSTSFVDMPLTNMRQVIMNRLLNIAPKLFLLVLRKSFLKVKKYVNLHLSCLLTTFKNNVPYLMNCQNFFLTN